MSEHGCDLAIIGGGLAGGLIALAVARAHPAMSLRLVESGPMPGGNHRWSWFDSDLDDAGRRLMDAIPHTRWDGGYDVLFPAHRRHLATPYRSMASPDFAAALARALPAGSVLTNSPVSTLDRESAVLETGERIAARCVIDCRGFAPMARLTGGWQVFLGRHLRLTTPHGLDRPIIMDATVEQLGGYRFVYALPLGEMELFVEDTYYQDSPTLDRAILGQRLDRYAAAHGWAGETAAEEAGVLPVITGGDFDGWQGDLRVAGVGRAGARGGFVHPLTSYTLPFAVDTALAIARHADMGGAAMAAMLERRAKDHWRAMRFYRLLGAMLFGAAPARERYRVFQRFYRLPAPLIERFYTGRSTGADSIRILCGRPPVPIGGALHALAKRGRSLKDAR